MKGAPVVTILGVANTGKSTLYNRLLGQRKALVHSLAGMTRDIIRGRVKSAGGFFYLQDSGGYYPIEEHIPQEINKRILREAERSDLLIFLFDGRRELLEYEKEFYLQIKKLKKPLIPVINKVDVPENYLPLVSYYSLKCDFNLISAEHNIDIETLLEKILSHIGDSLKQVDETEVNPLKITFIGKPNVGKSSIINLLLQDECTIVSPKPGTTRDSIDLEIFRNQQKFIIVDNAGIRKLQKVKEGTESAAVIRAERYMAQADIIVFVIDISRPIDQNDLLIAKKILKSARPVIIAANKWDMVPLDSRNRDISASIHQRFHQFYFAPVISVSAKSGKDIFSLIDQAETIHTILNKKINIKKLNELIQGILRQKKLFSVEGRLFAPKYISIESHQPFFVVFHGRNLGRLRSADEIYLKKSLVKNLKLRGIPVFFKIVVSE